MYFFLPFFPDFFTSSPTPAAFVSSSPDLNSFREAVQQLPAGDTLGTWFFKRKKTTIVLTVTFQQADKAAVVRPNTR